MKKTICICISLILLFSLCANAEEFTLHSGVTFGMNMDEVSTIETESGFTIETGKETIIAMGWHKPCGIHDSEYLTVSGTIAGYDGEIEYHFNNDTLESAIYFLGWGQTKGSCSSQFKEVTGKLSQKYGGPDDSLGELIERQYLDTCFYHTGIAYLPTYQMSIPASSAFKYSEEDGSVIVIYPAIIRLYFSDIFIVELLDIEYHKYSEKEYNRALTQNVSDNDDL